MKLPWVSRDRYNDLRAERDDLLEKYHALVAERAKPQSVARAPRVSRPPHDPIVDKMAADIQGTITDPAAARAEAERIKREAFGGAL